MRESALGTTIVCQVAIVVRDIERTTQAFAKLFGVDVPSANLTDPEAQAHTRYRGASTDARAKLAFFQLGQLSLELIEPVGGPSTWQEYLDTCGEGVHHLAFMVQGMDGVIAKLAELEMPAVQRGDYTGGRYAYIDSVPQLKVALELLENTGS